MSELKPCPFCGGEPEIINRSVHCNSASCNAQPFTSWWANDDAIAAWNRRAEDAALSRLRDTQRVLVEALEGLMEVERRGRVMPIGAAWDAARAALASVEQQQEQPCHQPPAGDEEVTARDWDGFDEWEDELTHFLLLLASRDDEVGRLAEGLGQFLPELRAAFARKRAAGVALPIEPKENDHG